MLTVTVTVSVAFRNVSNDSTVVSAVNPGIIVCCYVCGQSLWLTYKCLAINFITVIKCFIGLFTNSLAVVWMWKADSSRQYISLNTDSVTLHFVLLYYVVFSSIYLYISWRLHLCWAIIGFHLLPAKQFFKFFSIIHKRRTRYIFLGMYFMWNVHMLLMLLFFQIKFTWWKFRFECPVSLVLT